MNMTEAMDQWLHTILGEPPYPEDAGNAVKFLVENTDSESAQLFRLEVSAARRRQYQAELMRNRRRAVLRDKLNVDERGL